jgi:hypothetical protein
LTGAYADVPGFCRVATVQLANPQGEVAVVLEAGRRTHVATRVELSTSGVRLRLLAAIKADCVREQLEMFGQEVTVGTVDLAVCVAGIKEEHSVLARRATFSPDRGTKA